MKSPERYGGFLTFWEIKKRKLTNAMMGFDVFLEPQNEKSRTLWWIFKLHNAMLAFQWFWKQTISNYKSKMD